MNPFCIEIHQSLTDAPQEFLNFFLPKPMPGYLMVQDYLDTRDGSTKTMVIEGFVKGINKNQSDKVTSVNQTLTVYNLKILDEYIEMDHPKRSDVDFLRAASGDVIIENGTMTLRCPKCWNKDLLIFPYRNNSETYSCKKCHHSFEKKQ